MLATVTSMTESRVRAKSWFYEQGETPPCISPKTNKGQAPCISPSHARGFFEYPAKATEE